MTTKALASIALFAYVLWFRTHGVSDAFWLRGDQIRDWTIALKPFGELPLAGVPSSAGGTTLGPAYYWFLWMVARIGGLFTQAPHVGGIGVAAMQSIGDVILFGALLRRFHSPVLAMAVVLGAATSGYDATLSSMVWNPPVATAFGKLAIGAVLWAPEISLVRSVLAIAASWIAVHCHTSGFVVAIPVIAWLLFAPAVLRQWSIAGRRLAGAVVVIALLQAPRMVHTVQQPAPEGSRIADSLAAVAQSPADSIHPLTSARFVTRSLYFNLVAPFDEDRRLAALLGLLLLGALIATAFRNPDRTLVAMSAGPVAAAIVLFAFWQGPLEEAYWCLVLTPPAALALTAWIDRLPARRRTAGAWALLVVVIIAQPARAEMAWTLHRLPAYGDLLRGCRSGGVRRPAGLPADVDVEWLCDVTAR